MKKRKINKLETLGEEKEKKIVPTKTYQSKQRLTNDDIPPSYEHR